MTARTARRLYWLTIAISTVSLVLSLLTFWNLSQIPAHAAACKTVRAPADLQRALIAAGKGSTVCLEGTFHGSGVRPLEGQTIIGGALTGSSGDGFELRAANVTLRGVEVYGYPGRGVVCGPRSTIQGSYLHDNRRNGIGCIANGADWHLVITGNTITHNGSEKWAYQGAAGIKIMELSMPGHCLTCGALVARNNVSFNVGNGIWFDRSSSAATVRNNTTNGNTHKGIRCEKCAGPFAWYGNTARNNRDENLSIRNSAYVTLWDNTTSGSLGLRITWVTREATKTYPALNPVDDGYRAHGIRVDDLRLIDGGAAGCGQDGVRCST